MRLRAALPALLLCSAVFVTIPAPGQAQDLDGLVNSAAPPESFPVEQPACPVLDDGTNCDSILNYAFVDLSPHQSGGGGESRLMKGVGEPLCSDTPFTVPTSLPDRVELLRYVSNTPLDITDVYVTNSQNALLASLNLPTGSADLEDVDGNIVFQFGNIPLSVSGYNAILQGTDGGGVPQTIVIPFTVVDDGRVAAACADIQTEPRSSQQGTSTSTGTGSTVSCKNGKLTWTKTLSWDSLRFNANNYNNANQAPAPQQLVEASFAEKWDYTCSNTQGALPGDIGYKTAADLRGDPSGWNNGWWAVENAWALDFEGDRKWAQNNCKTNINKCPGGETTILKGFAHLVKWGNTYTITKGWVDADGLSRDTACVTAPGYVQDTLDVFGLMPVSYPISVGVGAYSLAMKNIDASKVCPSEQSPHPCYAGANCPGGQNSNQVWCWFQGCGPGNIMFPKSNTPGPQNDFGGMLTKVQLDRTSGNPGSKFWMGWGHGIHAMSLMNAKPSQDCYSYNCQSGQDYWIGWYLWINVWWKN